jgi:hypothetical protein
MAVGDGRRREDGARPAGGGGGGGLAGEGQNGLPGTISHGKATRRKRGARGRLPGA